MDVNVYHPIFVANEKSQVKKANSIKHKTYFYIIFWYLVSIKVQSPYLNSAY